MVNDINTDVTSNCPVVNGDRTLMCVCVYVYVCVCHNYEILINGNDKQKFIPVFHMTNIIIMNF